jgi:hypothetical protein
MGYTLPTIKKLFSLAGNECAFPGCTMPVHDTTHKVIVAQICHIRGKHPGSARYEEDMTDAERDDYGNLIVMCGPHHKVIDDEETRDQYPKELLYQFKKAHEARNQNTVVRDEELMRLMASLLEALPAPKPKAALTPVITSLLTKVDHGVGLDFYDFRVELRNNGMKVVRDFAIEVEIPQRYMENAGSYTALVHSRRPGETYLFRHTQQHFNDFALYPGAAYPVFSLGFVLKKEHYLQGIRESIKVYVYSDDEPVTTEEYLIAGLLNAERVEMIFGPRLNAIRKIYQATRDFVGEVGDLTDQVMYLADGPDQGKRSIHLENAYNMGKELAKLGWLVFESENAMSVRLTDEGVRAGS